MIAAEDHAEQARHMARDAWLHLAHEPGSRAQVRARQRRLSQILRAISYPAYDPAPVPYADLTVWAVPYANLTVWAPMVL